MCAERRLFNPACYSLTDARLVSLARRRNASQLETRPKLVKTAEVTTEGLVVRAQQVATPQAPSSVSQPLISDSEVEQRLTS